MKSVVVSSSLQISSLQILGFLYRFLVCRFLVLFAVERLLVCRLLVKRCLSPLNPGHRKFKLYVVKKDQQAGLSEPLADTGKIFDIPE